jgi:glutaredoxin-related protein
MIIQLLVTILSTFTVSLVQPVYAQENPMLFWGTTCPYCHEVIEEIGERGLDEQIDIEMLEIYENKENLDIFREKIEVCNINPNRAGVPLLYYEEECFIGPNQILSKLTQMADGEEVGELGEDIDEGVDPVVVEEESEGKKNTRILIGVIAGFLVLLVLIGYWIQSKKGSGIVSIFLILSMTLLSVQATYAMCPVCTAAVGLGLGFSRYFGIDDVITGVWIGGLVVSSIMWFVQILEKRNIKSILSKVLVAISVYGLLGLTLYLLDFIGHPLNRLWGIDKIVLGIVSGGVVFFLSARLHLYLKKKNNDKIYFPFQKVVFTVGAMLLLTFFFYMLVY